MWQGASIGLASIFDTVQPISPASPGHSDICPHCLIEVGCIWKEIANSIMATVGSTPRQSTDNPSEHNSCELCPNENLTGSAVQRSVLRNSDLIREQRYLHIA